MSRKLVRRPENLAIPGTITPMSLTLTPGLSFEKWERVGETLRTIESGVQWWLGDWLNYGERAYGEKYAQAVDESQAHTWRQYAWVASRFETSVRTDKVSFGVHERLAGVLDVAERHALLQRAAKEEWTVAQARETVRDLNRVTAPPLPTGKFFVVYVDPPWEFRNSGFTQAAAKQYPTMGVEEIGALKVPDLVTDRAVLFLWVPNSMLPDGLIVCAAWGFEYKTDLVWVKNRAPGMGFYVQSKHETLLLATRGEDMLPRVKPESWFDASVTDHSHKPEIAYDIVESMYGGPYVELFARRAREGWEAWGNEILHAKRQTSSGAVLPTGVGKRLDQSGV